MIVRGRTDSNNCDSEWRLIGNGCGRVTVTETEHLAGEDDSQAVGAVHEE